MNVGAVKVATEAVALPHMRVRSTVFAVEDTPEARQAIGERIRHARLMAGYENASEFAREVGVAPNTVYRWEGKALGEVKWIVPSIFQLESIARVTKVTTDWLLRGMPSPEAAEALAEWRKTPRGAIVSPKAALFLELVLQHVPGKPSLSFLTRVADAFEDGLTPQQTAMAVAFTEAKLAKANGRS